MYWHRPEILTLGAGDWNGAEDRKFKSSLDHILRPIFEEKKCKLRNNYKMDSGNVTINKKLVFIKLIDKFYTLASTIILIVLITNICLLLSMLVEI